MGDAWRLSQNFQKRTPRKMCHRRNGCPVSTFPPGSCSKTALGLVLQQPPCVAPTTYWGAACRDRAMRAVSPRARTRHWCRAWRDGGTPTIDWSRAARDAGAARVLAPCWPRHVAGNNHAVVIPSPRRHDVAGDMGDACVAPMIHRRWVSRDKPIASPMTTFLHKLRDLVSAHISAFLRRSRLLVSRVSTPSGTRAPSPTPGRMSTPTEGSREP